MFPYKDEGNSDVVYTQAGCVNSNSAKIKKRIFPDHRAFTRLTCCDLAFAKTLEPQVHAAKRPLGLSGSSSYILPHFKHVYIRSPPIYRAKLFNLYHRKVVEKALLKQKWHFRPFRAKSLFFIGFGF